MKPSFTVAPLASESPASQALLRKSDEYMSALYPTQSNHLESVQALPPPHGFVLGV